jgi:Flp pilus assembly pilin Flp
MRKVSGKRERGLEALGRDTRGLSTVEYIIILVLIAVAGIGLWTTFGDTVGAKIGESTDAIGGM